MAEPEAEWKRKYDRDEERDRGELQVLGSLRQQQTEVVGHETDRVDECPGRELVGDDHAARVQGVSACCASTSKKSTNNARPMVSRPAARISVLKRSCCNAM